MSSLYALGAVGALAALGAVASRRGSRTEDRLEELMDLLAAIREQLMPEPEQWVPKEQLDVDESEYAQILREQLPAYGYPVLGEGGNRIVVAFGDGFVAKIALDSSGEEQNWREYETWTDERDEEVGAYLVPVHEISFNDRVLIMERAVPYGQQREDWRIISRRMAELGDLISIYDAGYGFNWGWHDGELKVLDYGNRW